MIVVSVREDYRDLEVRVGDKYVGRVRVWRSGGVEAYHGAREEDLVWIDTEGQQVSRTVDAAVNRVLRTCGYGNNKGHVERRVVRRLP